MKKITKILLPIASTVAVVAPVMTITSCGVLLETRKKFDFASLKQGNKFSFGFKMNGKYAEEGYQFALNPNLENPITGKGSFGSFDFSGSKFEAHAGFKFNLDPEKPMLVVDIEDATFPSALKPGDEITFNMVVYDKDPQNGKAFKCTAINQLKN